MTQKNKGIAIGIVVAFLVLLAINFIRDRGAARGAFREGFDSTSGTTVRTP